MEQNQVRVFNALMRHDGSVDESSKDRFDAVSRLQEQAGLGGYTRATVTSLLRDMRDRGWIHLQRRNGNPKERRISGISIVRIPENLQDYVNGDPEIDRYARA